MWRFSAIQLRLTAVRLIAAHRRLGRHRVCRRGAAFRIHAWHAKALGFNAWLVAANGAAMPLSKFGLGGFTLDLSSEALKVEVDF